MKTAQQWLSYLKANPQATDDEVINIIKQIMDEAKASAKRETKAWLSQALDEGGGVYKP